jgi:hypothetical protein
MPAAIDAQSGRHLDTTCLLLESELPTVVTKWHPATKLLLLAALLLVPYLLWTSGDDTAPAVAASVSRPQPAEAGGGQPPPVGATPTAFVLPPLERLTAVVERPLFSPTRRMPVLADAVTDEAAPAEASPPVAAGPAEPAVRFFGTARQGGQAAALVTFPPTSKVGRLVPGDRVGEWEVLSVERTRLVLRLGGEQRTFEIFGAGAHVAARPPAAAAAKPPRHGIIRPADGAAGHRPPRAAAVPSPPDPAADAQDGTDEAPPDADTPDDGSQDDPSQP